MSEVEKHISKQTWASTEVVKTIALFSAMLIGSYGVGNTTVGALDRTMIDLRSDVQSVNREIAGIREGIDRNRAAIGALRAGTVNPANLSRIVAITNEIAKIDRDDSSMWTAQGKPRVSVIESAMKKSGRLDYKITAIERDHACAFSDKCRK